MKFEFTKEEYTTLLLALQLAGMFCSMRHEDETIKKLYNLELKVCGGRKMNNLLNEFLNARLVLRIVNDNNRIANMTLLEEVTGRTWNSGVHLTEYVPVKTGSAFYVISYPHYDGLAVCDHEGRSVMSIEEFLDNVTGKTINISVDNEIEALLKE